MKHIQGSLLTGYVTVLVKGQKPELFFQECIYKGVSVWNIKKGKKNVCSGNIKLRDVKTIKNINRQSNYKITFTQRKGFPFFLGRIMRKKEILLGIFFSILLIGFLSNIIWKVQITGVPKDLEEKINKHLTSYGVHPGAWTFTLDAPGDIQQKLVNDVPELLWIGVHKKGTTLFLEGVEKIIVKEEKVEGPRNLVATKTGVIKEMYVSKGLPKVNVNDYVEPGDMLVSGILNMDNESDDEDKEKEKDVVYVTAEGEIIARTWYEISVSIPLKNNYELLTGKQEKKYYLGVKDFRLPVWGFKTPDYEDIHTENNVNNLYFFKWKLPFKIVESILSEKTYNHITRTKEEAINVGIQQAKQELQLELGPDAKIISEKILHESIERGKVKLNLYVTVAENIVKTQPINTDAK